MKRLLARAFEQFAILYWPAARMIWRLRWWRLRLRVVFVARMTGSRVRFDIAPRVRIDRRIDFEVIHGTETTIRFATGSWLQDDCWLQLAGGTLVVGAQTQLRRGFRAVVAGRLQIGSGCVISWSTSCHCADSLTIGDLTIIGERSVITDSRHQRTGGEVPVRDHVVAAPTTIGDNVWIGATVIIGSGVTVGSHAVIGGNSVVTRDVPARWFAAGSPASPIRELEIEVESV
jgi:acetyltransferase-like isoleucine patch superfamily enzyme